MEVQENPKKQRKRMKAVYAKIREQMEFYFSDANLHKDRFLKKKMDETMEKYVDLDIFLNFNRVKSITTDLAVLAKALRRSDLLELNEDLTKVRRTTPVSEPANVDDRTVYVECLPPSVDHDWIKKVFSGCGKVVYVSLPKYKSTGDPKGFAFVEFDTEESAQKACEMLNNPPVDAGERPGRFPKTSKSLTHLEKQLCEAGDPVPAVVEDSGLGSSYLHGEDERPEAADESEYSAVKSHKKDRKRHRNISECSADSMEDSGTKKKQKVIEKSGNEHGAREGEGKEEVQEHKSESDRKRKRRRTDREEAPKGVTSSETENTDDPGKRKVKVEKQTSHEIFTGDKLSTELHPPPAKQIKRDEDTKSKRDRKRKKRPRKRRSKEKEIPELRVIPKHRWLMLRNEYISLQKKNMTRLKQSLMSRKQKEEQSKVPNEVNLAGKAPKKDLQFVPNVIIHVKAEEPMQRKELREKLSQCGDIAYIDVKDGLLMGHIRCGSVECAKNISDTNLEGWRFSLLQGDDEKQYWDKLVADREAKFSTNPKNKKRGTTKLIERAERAQAEVIQGKHVVFADE